MWFYQPPRSVETKHNGTMRLSRFFGAWKLMGHDGTEQTTPYMDALWRKVIARVAADGVAVRRCLVLGVALGSTFNQVKGRWADAALVGVDWEPELFKLGLELGVFRPSADVRFIEGDAVAVVPTLEGMFDLVLVDLFNGHKVADAVSDPRLQDAVAARLAPGGAVAVNRYDQPSVLEGWRQRFGEPADVRFQANHIAVFRRPGK